jgi:fluoride exporter
VEFIPSHEAARQGDAVAAERVSTSPRRPAMSGADERRRAAVVASWSRLRRALVRRRDVLAVIALGGALGSLARWGLAEALPHGSAEFPWATFITNVSGCFLIGLLMVFVIEVWPPSRYLRPFLGVGVLGGYTTFSTCTLDTRALLVSGNPRLAGVYLFGSLAVGFTCVWLAVFAARGLVRMSRRRRHRRHDRDAPGRAGSDGRNRVHPSDRASRRTS